MPGLATDISNEAEGLFPITDIGRFLANLLNVALAGGAVITLGYLIWGAIDWIMSEGDQEKLQAARKKITNALIGLALLALTWLLWQLVIYFLGIGDVSPGGTILHLD